MELIAEGRPVMTPEEYAKQDAVARELIAAVGETPSLVARLLRQAEVEEAIAVLREIADARGIPRSS